MEEGRSVANDFFEIAPLHVKELRTEQLQKSPILVPSCESRAKDRPGGPSQEQSPSEAIYIVSVPSQFNAQLSNSSNDDITVSNLTGTVRVTSNGGGFQFAHLCGPLDGETAGGGIQVNDCEGDLKLQSSGGAIRVSAGGGSLDGKGGTVSVNNFHGRVRVETGGGVIRIDKVIGKVDASSSGGSVVAVLPSPLSDDVTLSTSGGDVTVSIAENAAFTLDADTSADALKTDFPLVASEKARDHIKGNVNGGGKPLVLRTAGGSIHIKKL